MNFHGFVGYRVNLNTKEFNILGFMIFFDLPNNFKKFNDKLLVFQKFLNEQSYVSGEAFVITFFAGLKDRGSIEEVFTASTLDIDRISLEGFQRLILENQGAFIIKTFQKLDITKLVETFENNKDLIFLTKDFFKKDSEIKNKEFKNNIIQFKRKDLDFEDN